MANSVNILPSNAVLVDNKGLMKAEWLRYFTAVDRNVNTATAGTVTTAPGSGLSGGGVVADGINLSIANNGVSNTMLRQGAGTSVIGRAFGSAGNVADITADADNRVLSREGSQLAFRNFINGVSIGPTTAAPVVRTDQLSLTTAAVASSASADRSVPIKVNGVTLYLLLSTTP